MGASSLSRFISMATLLPVYFGHGKVNDHNVDRMHGGYFQSLASARSSQNGIPEGLEKRFLVFQHVLVIVDAKDYSAGEFLINR